LPEAIQSERQALNLVLQQHDAQLEKNLRGNLKRYERESATAQPR
jgi:hypothetical protein